MRWDEKNAYLKEKVYEMDMYEQALMDYKSTANQIHIASALTNDNDLKSVYLALSRNRLKEIEHELIELGHEIGIKTEQTRFDIDSARKGGKVSIVNRQFIKDNGENSGGVIRIRKRQIIRIKPKRKIIKKCRCKK